MRRIVTFFLFFLLLFASISFAESLDCLCDYVPYQVDWQGYYVIGGVDFWPSDDPDDYYIVKHFFPTTIEWVMLEVKVNQEQEANFRIHIPNKEVRGRHCFMFNNLGEIVANIMTTELSNNWYSITAYFKPGESTDLYYLVWVE